MQRFSSKDAIDSSSVQGEKSPRGSLRLSKSPRGSRSSLVASPKSPRNSIKSPRASLKSPRGSGLLSPRNKGPAKSVVLEAVKQVLNDGAFRIECKMLRDGVPIDGVFIMAVDLGGIAFYKPTSVALDDIFDVLLFVEADLIISWFLESVLDESRLILSHCARGSAKKNELIQFSLPSADANDILVQFDRTMLLYLEAAHPIEPIFASLVLKSESPVKAKLGVLLTADARNLDSKGSSKESQEIVGKRFVCSWLVKEVKAGGTVASEKLAPVIVIPSGVGIALLLPHQKVILAWYWRDVPSFGTRKDVLIIKHKSDAYSLKGSVNSILEQECIVALKKSQDLDFAKPFPLVYPPLSILRDRSTTERIFHEKSKNVAEKGAPTIIEEQQQQPKERIRGQLVVDGKVVKRGEKKQGNMIDQLGLETDEMKHDVMQKRLE